jgi:hypothetical protein
MTSGALVDPSDPSALSAGKFVQGAARVIDPDAPGVGVADGALERTTKATTRRPSPSPARLSGTSGRPEPPRPVGWGVR